MIRFVHGCSLELGARRCGTGVACGGGSTGGGGMKLRQNEKNPSPWKAGSSIFGQRLLALSHKGT